MIKTTLDELPEGEGEEFLTTPVRGNKQLPPGVTSKQLYRDAIKIAWPSFVEFMLMQLTSMADMMMVGNLGPWAIAAVGLTTQPKFLLATAFMSLNVGNMALVARYRGAGKQEEAKLVLRQAIMINFISALILSTVGHIFTEELVLFMGGVPGDTLEPAVAYLKIQLVGMMTVAMTTTITNALRAVGDSKTSMKYNVTANVVNVFLNYCLIEGHLGFPRLEVAGASLATVIGQFVAMLMAFRAILRKDQYVRLEINKGFKPDPVILGNIWRIGLPAMAEQLIMRAGIIIYAKTVAGLGTVLYAAHQVCMNIQALTFMNGQSFAVSATSLVGQSLGKKRGDMAVNYASRVQRLGMCVSILIGAVIFFFPQTLIALYNDDPTIMKVGATCLRMVAVIQPLQASQFILAGAMRGAGDTKYTAMVTLLTVLCIRPVAAIYAINVLGWGLEGAWVALVLDQLVRTSLIFHRFYTGKWRLAYKAKQ
ncbi:MAG: MATE family efflux transporter [Clostridia bacterium]|nr:MATE family efflux transporter [Clostridia bacterium]